MSPWSPKAYQVLAILENPTFKSPPKSLQERLARDHRYAPIVLFG
uniref:Uncharacterized protein n=1 Tax=Vitis vinifera TaxID=29760 RepID=F6GWC6_VITVI